MTCPGTSRLPAIRTGSGAMGGKAAWKVPSTRSHTASRSRTPGFLAELVNGFMLGARITDASCGYTNPPIVLIREGGGQGAVANAGITDGVVTAIQIADAGSCYSKASAGDAQCQLVFVRSGLH